jgi:alkanesulfonate monooxygenase SsuD/methylene tetrahydromethanopterin reductase-like flavin-dependent oxidoreductase (luciferase family)
LTFGRVDTALRAEYSKWSIRDLVINTGNRQNFVGSPATITKAINDFVQADASDGFILVPHITPTGLDEFADKVVPLLQEQGFWRRSGNAGTGTSVP